MNHWRLIKWIAPGFAERHEREARRRELEIEVVKRKQAQIKSTVEDNERRLEAIEAEIRLLSRGQVR